MAAQDPFAGFKAVQKEAWSLFTPMEVFTTPSAAKLVSFAGVATGQRLLDVGCGTGVAAITAARRGAKVRGLDLSPVLIERAREHAQLANLDVDFAEGDAESLPYGDNEFDVVLSQFGHMFAPRPEVTIAQMRRVLKPGGRFAVSDVVVQGEAPESIIKSMEAWTGCIAGALPDKLYLSLLR